MMTWRNSCAVITATLAAMALVTGLTIHPASAQEPSSVEMAVTTDLETLTCRELFKMDNDGRDFTIVFFHGVLSGKNDEMLFDADRLAEATDDIVDHCIDNPDAALLATFITHRQ